MNTIYRSFSYCSGPEMGLRNSYLLTSTARKFEEMPCMFKPKLTTNRELTAIYCPKPSTTSKCTTHHYVIYPTEKTTTSGRQSADFTPVEVVASIDDIKQHRPIVKQISVKPASCQHNGEDIDAGIEQSKLQQASLGTIRRMPNVKDLDMEATNSGKRKLPTSTLPTCTQGERARSRDKKSQKLKRRRRSRSNGTNRRNILPADGKIPLKKMEMNEADCKAASAKDKILKEKVKSSASKGKDEHYHVRNIDVHATMMKNLNTCVQEIKPHKSSEKDANIKRLMKQEPGMIASHPPVTEKVPALSNTRGDAKGMKEDKIFDKSQNDTGDFENNKQLQIPTPPSIPKKLKKQTTFKRRYRAASNDKIFDERKESETIKLKYTKDAKPLDMHGGDADNAKYKTNMKNDMHTNDAQKEIENTYEYMDDGSMYYDDDDDIIFGWKHEFPMKEMKAIKPKVLNKKLPSSSFYQSTEPKHIVRFWQMKRVELNMEIELMA